ncbi:MAG: hypothetical protein AAF681_00835 [Pseudomonadota bacterium]
MSRSVVDDDGIAVVEAAEISRVETDAAVFYAVESNSDLAVLLRDESAAHAVFDADDPVVAGEDDSVVGGELNPTCRLSDQNHQSAPCM